MSTRAWWMLTLAWAAVIFGLSSIPARHIPHIGFENFDKVAHACIYAVLGGLATLGFGHAWRGKRSAVWVVAAGVALATAYGASDEFHQRWTPGRSSDVWDLAADAVGSTVGAVTAASALL